MPKPSLQPLSINSVSRGALSELFESCVAKAVANILDTSTPAEAARTITLKLKLEPSSDRRSLTVTTSASCALAPIAEHTSRGYVGLGQDNKGYLLAEDPRQDVLFVEQPAADENLLNFKANTSN